MEPMTEATIAVVLERIDNLTKTVEDLKNEIHSDRADKVTRREWQLETAATNRRLESLEDSKARGWTVAAVVLSGLAIVASVALALI